MESSVFFLSFHFLLPTLFLSFLPRPAVVVVARGVGGFHFFHLTPLRSRDSNREKKPFICLDPRFPVYKCHICFRSSLGRERERDFFLPPPEVKPSLIPDDAPMFR